MQRFFIIAVNCVLLAAAIVAVPEITSARFWHWEISSITAAQTLTLWVLVFAAVGNAGSALLLFKGRKERRLCWQWAVVFAALLGVKYALVRGWFNLHWLQQAVVWLQKHL
ncbi:MAG TPA: hypothetical protein VFY06_10250 [Verrucomicrobiae bacterium]|nr:hypothetical protein [Verrucomicrobiae bacterium]